MGVYISGMEMPKSCWECRFNASTIDHREACLLTKKTYNWGMTAPPSDCPLVHVPSHGDLIDHNALKIAVMDCDAETRIDFLKHAMDCINKAPVVIPSDMPFFEAEEGE